MRNSRAIAGRLAGLMSPFMVGRLMDQVTHFDADELTTYLDKLRWADIQLKSTTNAPRSVLETAVLAAASQKNLLRPTLSDIYLL